MNSEEKEGQKYQLLNKKNKKLKNVIKFFYIKQTVIINSVGKETGQRTQKIINLINFEKMKCLKNGNK